MAKPWAALLVALPCALSCAASRSVAQPAGEHRAAGARSVYLERVAWPDAERALTPDAVVLIAVGAASKEHGPHLPLASDFLQADYVKARVAERTPVVVAPSVPYGYYPPFIEYPGSTSLRLSVARDLIADVCRSLARSSGVRRFYVISHGPISLPVMEQVRAQLGAEGLLLGFTDWDAAKRPVADSVRQQAKGSHADEMETSMLLYVAPALVDMRKAEREYGAPPSAPAAPNAAGGRMVGNRPAGNGVVSPSGVFGDPTVATREKGRRLTEAVIAAAVRDIEALRAAPLPPVVPLSAYFAGVDGSYEAARGDTIRVAREGDLLAVERRGRPKVLLQPAGRYRFGLWTTEARFFGGDGGAATHLVLSEGGKELLARRIE
jgi:creatinine amidohydrolase